MYKRKIRTLFILQNLNGGGAERTTLNLLRHLDRNRFEPVLLLLENTGVYFSEVPPHVKIVLAHKSLRYSKYLTPFYIAKTVIEAHRSDIVIAALELRPTYLAYIAGAITRRPVIGWVRVALDKWLKEWKWWHSYVVKLLYPRLTRIVSISHAVAQSVSNVTSIPQEKIRVIYNPYEINTIIKKGREKPPQWYVDILEKPTLITLGRMMNEKGFDILIRAHAKTLQRGISHSLVIVGSGRLQCELGDLANRLGVGDSVFMPGYVLNPYPLVKNATAFVLSSRYEGLSGVIIEALALGTPVVATACGGPTEVLSEGGCGILVPPEDVSALADGMAKILSDRGLREKFSKSGIERAKWFSPENRVPQWEDLLTEVAK